MKQFKFSLFIFVFGLFFCIPYNTNALENKVVSCNYQFTNENGEQIDLVYDVFADGSVDLPFTNGSTYSDDGRAWYHSSEFSSIYYQVAKINNFTITCPSIYVQENELGVTVYPNPNSSKLCSGRCYNITAATPILSSWAEKNGIESKKVLSTCTNSSMGFYNRQSYVFPYFRLYSDGEKKWSIDGKSYVPVTTAITGKVGDESFSITVNDSLLDAVFSSSKASCPEQIYRCVTKSETGYSYELSRDASSCTNDELSTEDGQQSGSLYLNTALGDPNSDDGSTDSSTDNSESVAVDDGSDSESNTQPSNCNAILGSTTDENSVAWLLQEILNYVKVLGPILVVILSSVDFVKAIISNDDESMKKAEKKLMIRLVLAVALFLIPTLVMTVLDLVGITTSEICGLH